MNVDTSLWDYFFHASIIVKLVMASLLVASVMSWAFIFQRVSYLKKIRQAMNEFENVFWSGADLKTLCTQFINTRGIGSIFQAGFKEYLRLSKETNISPSDVMEGAQRAMHVAKNQEIERLESRLSFLATVSSIAPYVGLFGTVWGIMIAVQGLAHVSQASIAMVAPGIAEALIATAMGLFAAIPAGVAYNYFSNVIDRLLNRYDAFQLAFSNMLYRQAKVDIKQDALA